MRDDVLTAARFVLPHRLKRLPFEEVALDDKVLERAMNALEERGIQTPKDEDVPDVEPASVPIELPSGAVDDGKKA